MDDHPGFWEANGTFANFVFQKQIQLDFAFFKIKKKIKIFKLFLILSYIVKL